MGGSSADPKFLWDDLYTNSIHTPLDHVGCASVLESCHCGDGIGCDEVGFDDDEIDTVSACEDPIFFV